MRVEFGNDKAIESYKDDEGALLTRDDPGQHVTTMEIPDDLPLAEALNTVIGTFEKHHIQPGETPAWIESDNELMLAMLQDHYDNHKKRPKNWG